MKWNKQHGNHSKMPLPIFWSIIQQKTIFGVVADLVQSYKAMACSMPLKVHSLDFHLDFFPEYLRTMSDEHVQ